jgi:hypothetical protein
VDFHDEVLRMPFHPHSLSLLQSERLIPVCGNFPRLKASERAIYRKRRVSSNFTGNGPGIYREPRLSRNLVTAAALAKFPSLQRHGRSFEK